MTIEEMEALEATKDQGRLVCDTCQPSPTTSGKTSYLGGTLTYVEGPMGPKPILVHADGTREDYEWE